MKFTRVVSLNEIIIMDFNDSIISKLKNDYVTGNDNYKFNWRENKLISPYNTQTFNDLIIHVNLCILTT